jgi:uncharacterized membrane protein (UPF0127 family)
VRSLIRSSAGSRSLLRRGAVVLCIAAFATACGSGQEPNPQDSNVGGTDVEASNVDGSMPSSVDTVGGTVAGSAPTTSSSTPENSDSDAADGVLPEGFTTVSARITAADGEVCEVCLWLADSDEERGRGLMGVTDLGEAAGMAFVFDPATTGSFYMFQTPTPLSIAWFGEDGTWVGAADMEPCLDATAARCALYSPGGAAYTVGVETFAGGLEPLLMVEGSTIELVGGTESPECQTPSS